MSKSKDIEIVFLVLDSTEKPLNESQIEGLKLATPNGVTLIYVSGDVRLIHPSGIKGLVTTDN